MTEMPPPDRPACVGKDPEIFEFDLFYPEAVSICSTCPVRAWCLRYMDPIRNRAFSGVAGGYPWHDGYPNARYIDENDQVLVAYLATRRANVKNSTD